MQQIHKKIISQVDDYNKNFQTLNDFDKYIEPWELCSGLLQKHIINKIYKKQERKKNLKAQDRRKT